MSGTSIIAQIFISLKGAAQARLSLHLSKDHIVGNHMSWLICFVFSFLSHSLGDGSNVTCVCPSTDTQATTQHATSNQTSTIYPSLSTALANSSTTETGTNMFCMCFLRTGLGYFL